ncbi:MAG TPA: translocation/assembly module TamB domain-containing protein [Tangfeifania sp.]|nr:translocation/assembly module TamB domain-containing protein [Tangfeifania sp.]
MKKGITYGLRILGWLIAGILILLLLVSLLIQTRPVKERIARISEKQAGNVLNGELSIGKIDGNFFTGLSLENILLTYQNDTLAYIEKFSANYNLLPLLSRKLDVTSAEIVRPYFFLKQNNDSTWNVENLIKTSPEEKDTTAAEPGKFEIDLSGINISGGSVKTQTIDTIIPEKVENLNTQFSLFLKGNEQEVNLNEFSFSTQNPDFTLDQLSFQLKRDTNFTELNDFYIKTAKNEVEGNTEFNPPPEITGDATFETEELYLNEFEYFIPGLKIPARPVVKIDAQATKDSVIVNLELKENDQLIAIGVSSPNLQDFLFGDSPVKLIYQLNGKLENIRLGHWIGNPQLDYLVNGKLTASGKGTDPADAQLKVDADFNETIIEQKRLSELLVNLEFDKGNLSGTVSGDGEFGKFKVVPNIQNLLEVPDYTAKISTSNLNLAVLTGNDTLSSGLNLEANLKGRGFEPGSLSASGKVMFTDSRFSNFQVDTLFADAGYGNENLKIDSLRLKSKTINLQAHGNYSFRAASDIQLTATFTGTEEFQNFIPVENLNSSGEIKARLQGNSDSLQLNTTIGLNKTQFEEFIVQQLNLTANGTLTKRDTTFNITGNASDLAYLEHKMDSLSFNAEGSLDSLMADASVFRSELNSDTDPVFVENFNVSGNARLAPEDTLFNVRASANNITSGQNKLDSVTVKADGSLDSLFVEAGIDGNEISTRLKSGIVPGDQLRLTITEWQIDYKNQNWALQQPPAILEIDSLNYNIDNFKLASGSADSAQHILLQGNISRKGEEDFRLEMANLNIEKLSELLDLEVNPAGFFDLSLNLEGTSEAPLITGNYKLSNASFNDYQFTKFNGSLNYENGRVTLKSLIVPQDSGRFDVTATLPVQLNLDTMGYHLNPKDPIDGSVLFEKFPLAILQTFDIPGNIVGNIEGKVNLDGTIESPSPTGNLKLQDASVKIGEYGIDYRDIRLNLNFSNNQVVMDTFNIRTDDGNLTGTGQVDFASDFYKGNVSESQINFNFNKFNLVDHNQFNMQLSGHANLGGEKGNVVYGGDLKIPQAEIYLPAILGMMGQLSTPDMPKPILVEQVEKMSVSADSLEIETFAPPKPDSLKFDYFENFQGQLRIRIPKNTWVKNEDMRIEISGELELIKNQEFFELFGSVDVVRGQYDLLGKTFVIEEGSISFQGGEELTPRMNIEAVYTFRNAQRVKQELSVSITGTPESPEVNFTLDGSSVSEGDALSYILFGKGMNELSMSEQENVSGRGNLAEKAAASVISSQLSAFLGDKLNVDYIEVKSEGSFKDASVVVGKYITNDLFVSYEQRFGEVHEKDVAKYEVKLEYELFRFLFFELNNSSYDSGFDVIVKFDVK